MTWAGRLDLPSRQLPADNGGALMFPRVPYILAVLAGAVLWIGTAQFTGRQEAWDASVYWALTYPLGILVSGALAYVWPHTGAWRLGLVLMIAQAISMTVTSRSLGLLPLGLVLCTLLAIPPAGGALIASLVAHHRSRGVSSSTVSVGRTGTEAGLDDGSHSQEDRR